MFVDLIQMIELMRDGIGSKLLKIKIESGNGRGAFLERSRQSLI